MSCQRILPGALAPGDRVRETHHVHLDPVPRLVAEARRFVLEHAPELPAETQDSLVLLTSELVTNAVLHARTEFTVRVVREGETVRVTVEDGSLAVPRQRTYGTDSTTGRGLRLVETLSAAWGVDPLPGGGKAVWFEVPAGGDAGRSVDAWEDDVDVEALLVGFGDDGEQWQPSAPTALRVAA